LVKRREALLVLALVLVGALLRLPLLSSRPFWFDELGQLSVSRPTPENTVAAVLSRTMENERAPPGYSLLLHAMILVGGDSEWIARLPSFVAGVASIVMAFLAGKRWSSARAGLVCAALVAVSPPFVFFAREARAYSVGAFAVLWLLAEAPRAVSSARGAALLACASAACALTQWVSLLVVFAVFASQLPPPRSVGGPGRWGRILPGTVVTSVVLLLEAPILLAQLHARGSGGGFLEGSFYERSHVLEFARQKVPELLDWLVVDKWKLGVLPSILVAIAVVPALARRVAYVALVPVALVFLAAGWHLHPFGGSRHCLPLAPGIFLLVACGLDELSRRSRVTSAFLAACLVGCSAYGIHDVRDWYFEDVPGVIADARAASREGDVLFVEAWSRPAFEHYGGWSGPVVISSPWTTSKAIASEIEASFSKGKRVWVLYAREREKAVGGAAAMLVAATFEKGMSVERQHGPIYVRATLWEARQ
jgi:hypothetical protein